MIKPAPSSLGKSLSVASAIMMASVFLSRVLAILRDLTLAWFGGTSSQMDAYVAAFLIPDILNHLLAGGFMSVTFIPIFQKHLAAGDEARAWRVFSNLLVVGTVVLTALVCLSMFFTDPILGLMGRQISDPAQRALTGRMTRIILPAQICFYWGALLMAVQYAKKKFLMPALAPLVYNLGIIGGGIALGRWIGIEGFAWGVLAGALLGNLALQVSGARAAGMRFTPVFDLRDPDLKTYVLVTVPLVLGLGMQFSTELFFRYFGSFLGEGGISGLNYSLRIMWTLVGVFGQAVGVASFPFLASLAAEKKFGDMDALAHGVVTKVIAVIVPIAAVMMVLSVNIVAVMYQRGRFDAASTALTAEALAWYLAGSFAVAAHTIVMRNFYALQNTLLPMCVSTAAAIVCIPLFRIFSARMGANGIALVSSVLMAAQFTVLFTIWNVRYSSRQRLGSFLAALGKIAGVGAVTAGLCIVLRRAVSGAAPVAALPFLWKNLAVCLGAGAPPLALALALLDAGGLVRIRRVFQRKPW